ncbi:four helix bundle protein [candidate division WOR-3 bacterium]|nr:four helix bundle protein [candidate division WOR-3 bacterium]
MKQEDEEGRKRRNQAQEAGRNKPRGHEKMIVWQNMDKLDIIVQKILKKIPRFEVKMRSQIDNASDSVGANFVEGYYSGSIPEYLKFLRYSKRSLGELRERVRRVSRKGYILDGLYEEFTDLAIKTMYLIDRLRRSSENK